MKRQSIRVRLAAWNALILMSTLAAAGLATWLTIRDSIHDTVDQQLYQRWDALRGDVVTAMQERRAATLERDLTLAAGTALRIAEGGRVLYASADARDWGPAPADASELPEEMEGRTVFAGGHPVRVLALPVAAAGTTRIVEIGTPVDEFYEVLDQFTNTALLATPLLLLVAAGGGYLMSRRALEPVDRITHTALAIGAHNLGERLPLRGVDDELERLSNTLNGMFARLDDAFRRITRFTADASHELRTPIAIIRTAAEICSQRPRSEAEYRDTLDRILVESERTSRLIDDLLMLARADAEGHQVVMEPLDLATLLRDTCVEAEILCRAAGVQFSRCLPSSCATTGDSQQLGRLFLILLDNAVKYTPAGGTLSVTMTVEAGTAVIEVRDTGIGIPPAVVSRIFERFYRVSSDRSRASGGAGLGLSIAQWIVAAHQGEILVESVLGKGSVFRVKLPRVAESA